MASAKQFLKKAFSAAGYDLTRRDRLAEQIPGNYLRSAYLPPIYRHSFGRLAYFRDMFERVRAVPGDIVECGVSIGTGILNWALLTELSGADRRIFGFDSFAGFPSSTRHDLKADRTYQTSQGDYASPPELVLRVLREARVSPSFIDSNVRLVRGFFDATLPKYDGTIALLNLDCDLYESYVTCLRLLFDRVAPGGVVMFDEYDDERFPGARRAVDEYFAGRAERVMRYEQYGYVKFFVVKP